MCFDTALLGAEKTLTNMAYNPKQGGEQETMYRFLTPGEAEQQPESLQDTVQGGILTRKLRRLSVMYMTFVTPNEPHEEPPVCRFLASCLVVMGFTTGTALVALFFYVGFAYGIDEGFMLGVFTLGSWVYGLVTYFRKTGCFRPPTGSDSSVSSIMSASSVNALPPSGQDPPSYKEVTKNPPSYQEALKMMEATKHLGPTQSETTKR